MAKTYFDQINESSKSLEEKGVVGKVGLVLGTGLGTIAESLNESNQIPFEDCPYFPQTTAISHAGTLHVGQLFGRQAIVMEGRFHLYEGWSAKDIALPIYVMKNLGVETLILTGACGGLNLSYQLGDLVLAEDYINNMSNSPLTGLNQDELGPRFVDMSKPYSSRLNHVASKQALKDNISVHKGVYIGVNGPELSTRAEYRRYRQMGADIVGMSTIPETIAANHAGMEVVSLNCVTDICDPNNLETIDVPRIIRTAGEAEPKLSTLIKSVIEAL